jgi:hypothetical protein
MAMQIAISGFIISIVEMSRTSLAGSGGGQPNVA